MTEFTRELLTWLGIVLCLSQSAMFSGLNLAMLGMSRLRLEVESVGGNVAAKRILAMRQDANFLLTTILWGNVAINVLLTLLSDSVMAGVSAFLFSTVAITFFGEITPQAYFSRNAMRMGALLSPLLRMYQFLLYPVAKPSALALDLWLGKEGIQYFREHNLRNLIKQHIQADESDIDRIEGLGALNFLALDDLLTGQQGQPLDDRSIIALPCTGEGPVFPAYRPAASDTFLQQVAASGKKWVIIVDPEQHPRLVINANAFLRSVYISEKALDPLEFAHKPLIVREQDALLGQVLGKLKLQRKGNGTEIIDEDLILFWGEQARVITGADILARLLQGISRR